MANIEQDFTSNIDDNASGSSWERQTINELLFTTIKEQRRSRRWGIFFKLCFMFYILGTIVWVFREEFPFGKEISKEHTALIEIIGEISKDRPANADDINKSLKNAFQNKQTKGVVLKINSPGGSPVQSRQIYNNITNLQAKYPHIKVYAAIEDLGTSGAYLVASAANQIYADETSLIGSIGVIINGFGFVEALNKLGVERRIYTAGKNKAMLDPFSPKNPEHEAFITKQLDLTHKIFIKNVIDKRPQLASNPKEEDLLSGKFWVGQAAKELGLIDGFGDVEYIANNIIKATEIRDFTLQPSFADKITGRFKVMLRSLFLDHFYSN